jgi:competence protein ComFC
MESGETKLGLIGSPLSNLYDSVLNLVYPQYCQICEKSVESRTEGFVCRKCWRKTKIFTGKEILCHKCGAFLRDGFSEHESFCRHCDEDSYDRACAVGLYEKALLVSVLNLKREPFIPKVLENLFLKAFLNSHFQDTTRIIPVPLAKNRSAERGFNQAFLLAQSLSTATKIKIDDKSLIRQANLLKHRAGMDRKARMDSVKKVFEVTAPRLIENEIILLIDDVFTSGATVSYCAKVLKKHGASKIYVLTVARAK